MSSSQVVEDEGRDLLMEEIAKRILEEIPYNRFVRHCNVYLQLVVVEEGGR